MLTLDNTIRNLIYHIYPVINHQRWEWNVRQLCKRLHLFNGKIIVAITTDPPEGRKADPIGGPNPPDSGRIIRGCDTAEKVKEGFAKHWQGKPIQFMEFENDPHLREVKTIMPMLSEVLTDDPYSITLYAQAKGVTRAPGHIAHRWTEVLYEVMLDYFPLAIEQLNDYPITGCFKKLARGWPAYSSSEWHYSSSWFHVRSAALFEQDWRRADAFWSGIESYPSQHFSSEEAGCLFHHGQYLEMFSSDYWKQAINQQLNEWRMANAKYHTNFWPSLHKAIK